MASMGVVVRQDLGVAELAALSRAALDRPLRHVGELLVAVPTDEAIVLGAHQRASELPVSARLWRGSGGAAVRVGTGTLWVQLALAESGALVPCAPDRLVNRYVRPLLRALTKNGVLTHYFERDWVSAASRPVGAVGLAHDTATGRALFEALIAVATPFEVCARRSFMGKEPATLAALGMRAGSAALADAVAASYRSAFGPATEELSEERPGAAEVDVVDQPRWAATCEEAIGLVAAGRDRHGRLRVGGELMVSRDALARLEEGLARLSIDADPDAVGALVDATLGAPGVALFGVRSLRSLRDVIVAALARESAAQ